jgi:hypothetical protein
LYVNISSVGLVDEGYKLGQVARAVFDRFQNRSFLTRFYSVYYLGVHCWKHPLSEFIEEIKHIHHVGLETGDIEFAMVSHFKTIVTFMLTILSRIPFCHQFTGFDYFFVQFDVLSLAKQYRGYQTLLEQARVLQQSSSILIVEMIQESVRVLGDESYGVDGELMADALECKCAETKCYEMKEKLPILYKMSCVPQIIRRFLFGDYAGAKAKIVEYYVVSSRTEMYPSLSSILILLEGLVYIYFARLKSQRLCYRGRGCSIAVRNFANHEPYGHSGRHMLLEAELADLFGHSEGYTLAKYTSAISVEKDSGSLMTLAIANELTARFLIRRHRKHGVLAPVSARRYICDSMETYKKWGAMAKVRHFQQEMYGYGYNFL